MSIPVAEGNSLLEEVLAEVQKRKNGPEHLFVKEKRGQLAEARQLGSPEPGEYGMVLDKPLPCVGGEEIRFQYFRSPEVSKNAHCCCAARERPMGVEPTAPAWKADRGSSTYLALFASTCSNFRPGGELSQVELR